MWSSFFRTICGIFQAYLRLSCHPCWKLVIFVGWPLQFILPCSHVNREVGPQQLFEALEDHFWRLQGTCFWVGEWPSVLRLKYEKLRDHSFGYKIAAVWGLFLGEFNFLWAKVHSPRLLTHAWRTHKCLGNHPAWFILRHNLRRVGQRLGSSRFEVFFQGNLILDTGPNQS